MAKRKFECDIEVQGEIIALNSVQDDTDTQIVTRDASSSVYGHILKTFFAADANVIHTTGNETKTGLFTLNVDSTTSPIFSITNNNAGARGTYALFSNLSGDWNLGLKDYSGTVFQLQTDNVNALNIARTTANVSIGLNSAAPTNTLLVKNNSTGGNTSFVVQAGQTQTSNLISILNNSNVEIFSVDKDANITYNKNLNKVIVISGDSWSNDVSQFGSAGDFPTYFLHQPKNHDWDYVVKAVAGRTVATMLANYATDITPYKRNYEHQERMLILYGGINDLFASRTATDIYNDLKTMWSNAKADGFTTIAYTVCSATTLTVPQEAQRVALNTLILSDRTLYDYMIEAAVLFPEPSNTLFFDVDGTHLNTNGATYLGERTYEFVYKDYLAVQPTQAINLGNGRNLYTDIPIKANSFIKVGGTSSQFLKADGSVDSTTYEPALGFTPENVANKSDSYTTSSSTTYASTKALVDGLTTKQNKFIINVKDYGATGNGTTDDTAAINLAFAALPAAGGTLYFPNGVYHSTTGYVFVGNNISIIGELMPRCADDLNSLTGGTILRGQVTVDGSNILVENIGVDFGITYSNTYREGNGGNALVIHDSALASIKKNVTVNNAIGLIRIGGMSDPQAAFHALIIEGVQYGSANNIVGIGGWFGVVLKVTDFSATNVTGRENDEASLYIKSKTFAEVSRVAVSNITVSNQVARGHVGVYVQSSERIMETISLSNVVVSGGDMPIRVESETTHALTGFSLDGLVAKNTKGGISVRGNVYSPVFNNCSIYSPEGSGFIVEQNFSAINPIDVIASNIRVVPSATTTDAVKVADISSKALFSNVNVAGTDGQTLIAGSVINLQENSIINNYLGVLKRNNIVSDIYRYKGGGITTSLSDIATTANTRIDLANPTLSLMTGYVGSDAPYVQSYNNSSNTSNILHLNPFGGNVVSGGNISAPNYTGSATLTGTPTAPTAAPATNTTQIATTAFVLANAGSGTNLTYTASPTNGLVISDTGIDATIPLADGTNAGLLKPADFTTLANGVVKLTGDQTKTGNLTFVNPIGGGSKIILTNNNTSSDASLTISSNTNVSVGMQSVNTSGGIGILGNNTGSGISYKLENISTGKNLVLNNSTAATGTPFTIQKNAVDKLTINDAGEIKQFGSTSGDVTIKPNAVAGTATVLTLPATTGTLALTSENRITTKVLTADQTNSTVTLTKVTGLDQTLDVGTYQFKYMVRYQSDATTTGVRLSVNHSGTLAFFVANVQFIDASATASTATAKQNNVNAAGGVMGGFSARAKSTTGWGTTLGVDTINSDMLTIVEGTFEVTASGDIQLYHGSEIAASVATIKAGSSLVVTKVN